MQKTQSNADINNVSEASLVSLISFKTIRGMNEVHLEWTVNKDKNVTLFEVEYSITPETWFKIAEVPIDSQTAFSQKYRFSHETPQTGSNFYRLKVIYKNNLFAYSNVRSVKFSGEEGIILHSRPVFGRFKLNNIVYSEITRVRVFNIAGGLMMDVKSVAANGVNLSLLAPGTYLVSIDTRDGMISDTGLL